MSEYSTKKAIVDLGFVSGFFHSRPSNIEDDGWWDNLTDALDRAEGMAIKGSILSGSPTEGDYRQFLHDLGFVRGWAWLKETPDGVSEAINRLINYFTETLPVTEITFGAPKKLESRGEMVSDNLRHEVTEHYKVAPTIDGIAALNGIANEVMERIVAPIRDKEAEVVWEAEMIGTGEEKESAESTVNEATSRSDYEWGTEEKDKLLALRVDHPDWTWKRIGEAMGKTGPQCSSMYHGMKKKGLVPSSGATTESEDKAISDDAWPDVQAMLVNGDSRESIAERHGSTLEEVNGYIERRLQANRNAS